jgi:two-component system chemotaxis response regulator CheY
MKTSAILGMRILIADDQKGVGTTLAALVSHCQHEVVEVVGSGLEAIQAYERHKPDVVLMDYWMAKLNGATACRNIVAKDPAARVILVSAWSPASDLSDSGAIAVLSKPVDLEKLEAALDNASQHLSFQGRTAA